METMNSGNGRTKVTEGTIEDQNVSFDFLSDRIDLALSPLKIFSGVMEDAYSSMVSGGELSTLLSALLDQATATIDKKFAEIAEHFGRVSIGRYRSDSETGRPGSCAGVVVYRHNGSTWAPVILAKVPESADGQDHGEDTMKR